MNELTVKKNTMQHGSRCEPSPEPIEVGKPIHVFTVSVIVAGVCLAIIGIFFMSCGIFHVTNVGEALIAFNTFLFS